MKNKLLLAFMLWMVCWLTPSCATDCDCTKDLKCTIITVTKRNASDSNTVAVGTFCSQTDYHQDDAFRDSVDAFQKRYTTDSTILEFKDSIYKNYTPLSVREKNLNRYIDSGYFCGCPR